MWRPSAVEIPETAKVVPSTEANCLHDASEILRFAEKLSLFVRLQDQAFTGTLVACSSTQITRHHQEISISEMKRERATHYARA